jgi:hypothetical protein
LFLLVALSPAAQAAVQRRDFGSNGLGIQLLQGPENRVKDPRAHRYIVDHLAPGTTIRRTFRVVNHTPDRKGIEIYPAAASLADEKFVFGADHATNDLSSWVSLDKGRLTLAPGAGMVVRATIAVPATASAGERYAVIWASSGSGPGASGNVGLINRIGIRIYLDIGPGGEPRSDFTITKLVPSRTLAGDPSLAATVTNTGGRALDMEGAANLSDGPASQRAGPFPVTGSTTLAPGETGTVTVLFPRALPNGPWKIVLDLKSGMVSHSITAEITFPDPGKTGHAGKILTWMSNPWILAGGVLLISLALLGLLAFLARRSRNRQPAD